MTPFWFTTKNNENVATIRFFCGNANFETARLMQCAVSTGKSIAASMSHLARPLRIYSISLCFLSYIRQLTTLHWEWCQLQWHTYTQWGVLCKFAWTLRMLTLTVSNFNLKLRFCKLETSSFSVFGSVTVIYPQKLIREARACQKRVGSLSGYRRLIGR